MTKKVKEETPPPPQSTEDKMAKKVKEETPSSPQSTEDRIKQLENTISTIKKEWDRYKAASPFYKATVPPALRPQKQR